MCIESNDMILPRRYNMFHSSISEEVEVDIKPKPATRGREGEKYTS